MSQAHRFSIRKVMSEDDMQRCFSVMQQLRPDLEAEMFVAKFQRLLAASYEAVLAEHEGRIVGVAGFRITETFMPYRYLYVFELVVDSDARGQGVGSRLFDWLVDHARSRGCTRLQLDSAYFRTDAHRFYLHKGMVITRHYFDYEIPESL